MYLIDSHQHFLDVSRFHYDWIPKDSLLMNNYLPEDIKPFIKTTAVDKTIVVQAHSSLEETHWLLAIAEAEEFVVGVVGWIDLIDPNVGIVLDTLQKNPYFKGVRYNWEDELDPSWLLVSGAVDGLKEIQRRGLPYDFLVKPSNLPYIPRIMELVPDLHAVIDHIAKPSIVNQEIEPWLTNLREIANFDNIFCKLSGMVTEADHRNWNIYDLQPYVNYVLDMFGSDRILLGTDWPVCTLAASYSQVVQTTTNLLDQFILDVESERKISHENAILFYDLDILRYEYNDKPNIDATC